MKRAIDIAGALAGILVFSPVWLFLLAAINWPQSPVGLGWLGLFFVTLAVLIGGHALPL